MTYDIRFYSGDYIDRQRAANADKCVAYIEQHFNASDNPSAGYACAVLGSNASEASKAWGRTYCAMVKAEFGVPNKGILVGGYQGRGDGNLKYTAMPAILTEPLFASNPSHAKVIRDEAGQRRLAKVLADSIREHFPNGGRIGFSVGHKGRTTKPNDRGAVVVGGGAEADFAEPVLRFAAALLSAAKVCPTCKQVIA